MMLGNSIFELLKGDHGQKSLQKLRYMATESSRSHAMPKSASTGLLVAQV